MTVAGSFTVNDGDETQPRPTAHARLCTQPLKALDLKLRRVLAVCDVCGSNRYVDTSVHDGQSCRRDCTQCNRFLGWVKWYGKPADEDDASAIAQFNADLQRAVDAVDWGRPGLLGKVPADQSTNNVSATPTRKLQGIDLPDNISNLEARSTAWQWAREAEYDEGQALKTFRADFRPWFRHARERLESVDATLEEIERIGREAEWWARMMPRIPPPKILRNWPDTDLARWREREEKENAERRRRAEVHRQARPQIGPELEPTE